jgi:hypothetical protein
MTIVKYLRQLIYEEERFTEVMVLEVLVQITQLHCMGCLDSHGGEGTSEQTAHRTKPRKERGGETNRERERDWGSTIPFEGMPPVT